MTIPYLEMALFEPRPSRGVQAGPAGQRGAWIGWLVLRSWAE